MNFFKFGCGFLVSLLKSEFRFQKNTIFNLLINILSLREKRERRERCEVKRGR